MPFSLVRRRQAAVASLLVTGALVATACSSSSTSSAPKPSSSGASASADANTPAVFPTVSGAYGTKPALTFPAQNPSSKLAVKVLSEGSGPVVANNDLVIVDYLGQIWKGKVFDNSYDRKQPFGTPIGAGQVIKGWDTALVGKKVGSRVLMVVPPAEGYGSSGNTSAGIKGTDTLVFVVDIVNRYNASAKGDAKAVPQNVNTGDVTVTGALGSAPTITIKKGAPIPKAATATVLAKSTGAPVKPGLIVMQYVANYYDGTLADSTFERKYPLSVTVGSGDTTSPFEKLIGVPLGSRVLLTLPAQDASGKTAGLAIVVDLIAEESSAKPAK